MQPGDRFAMGLFAILIYFPLLLFLGPFLLLFYVIKLFVEKLFVVFAICGAVWMTLALLLPTSVMQFLASAVSWVLFATGVLAIGTGLAGALQTRENMHARSTATASATRSLPSSPPRGLRALFRRR